MAPTNSNADATFLMNPMEGLPEMNDMFRLKVFLYLCSFSPWSVQKQ